VTNINKAVQLDGRLDQISDPHIRLSLELQAAFGLRKEECMKLQPAYADRGDTLALKASWTKGGRPREIPIRNDQQRELLNRAHALAGNGSMIPPERSYKQQEQYYDRQCQAVGFHTMHGLRHAYAHERYHELTGWDCPVLGGPKSIELTEEQRKMDHDARLEISHEMGHGREQISAAYLGR
jgi:integrase